MRAVFTIGYEGTDITRFVETLVEADVQVLIDVRALPLSRKKGFSKRALGEHLSRGGVRYVHLKGLGDPKPGREAARAGRYEEFRAVYAHHLQSSEATAALSELERISGEATTCLMCFERDPVFCHRLMISEALRGKGQVHHLYATPNGPAAHITRRDPHQGATPA
jgi:uncharacterized protein (DUF488 family)